MSKNLLLVVVGSVLGLAICEAVLAWLDPPFFSPPVRIYDPLVGWRSRPGLHEPVAGIAMSINSAGFRDHERTHTKKPGQRRLLVLGDSFTQAAQVELEATYWALLEKRLGPNWEVMALAASDYGTTQEMLLFEEEGLQYQPDALLLQFFPLNDIFNNTPLAAHLFSNQDAYRPYLEPETGDITYLAPWTSWWRRHSRLARHGFAFLNYRGHTWGGETFWQDDQQRLAATDALAVSQGYHEKLGRSAFLLNVFAAEADQLPMVRAGWQATDAALARLVGQARRAGIPITIAVFPHEIQLSPSLAWRRKYLPFAIDPTSAGRRVAQVAGNEARVLDLIELFEAHLDAVRPYDQGHFNRAAHRLTADWLAAQLGAPTPPPSSAAEPVTYPGS